MRIQSGNTKSVRRTSSSNSSIASSFFVIVKLAILLVVIGTVFNYYIYLNQKIVETESNTRKIELRIKNVKFDIKSLEIQKEELSAWTYISSMIKKYNLKLREPMPGQVETLKLYDNTLTAKNNSFRRTPIAHASIYR